MNAPRIKFNNAADYDRMMGVWSQSVGDVFLDWLKSGLGKRWLDIGCGTGAFTQQIKDRCAPSEMIAVDPSDVQLEFARARGGMENCIFQSADAMALPFENEQFDASTMALVLFFVRDPEKGLSEMMRVTKKMEQSQLTFGIFLEGAFQQSPYKRDCVQ